MKAVYETRATAIGGREGCAASCDGRLKLRLDPPPALGGAGREGTNPEQLFAAGYAACFLSAIKRVAAGEKIRIAPDSNVTATVGVGPGPGDTEGGLTLSVALAADLPGLDRETGERLVAAAHRVCAFSNATRGNVDVRLSVI